MDCCLEGLGLVIPGQKAPPLIKSDEWSTWKRGTSTPETHLFEKTNHIKSSIWLWEGVICPRERSHIRPWEKENHLQKCRLVGDMLVPWRAYMTLLFRDIGVTIMCFRSPWIPNSARTSQKLSPNLFRCLQSCCGMCHAPGQHPAWARGFQHIQIDVWLTSTQTQQLI